MIELAISIILVSIIMVVSHVPYGQVATVALLFAAWRFVFRRKEDRR